MLIVYCDTVRFLLLLHIVESLSIKVSRSHSVRLKTFHFMYWLYFINCDYSKARTVIYFYILQSIVNSFNKSVRYIMVSQLKVNIYQTL